MMKNFIKIFAGFLLAILLIFGSLWLTFPKANDHFLTQKLSNSRGLSLHYVALGDSLTEGVGDATGQGGFVPLFAKKLENAADHSVSSENFGKAGDTSTQIYDRMLQQEKIRNGLKKADIITITVGGNDVMKVIRDNVTKLFTMDEKDFVQPEQAYQKQVKKLLDTIRKNNPKAEIYVLGIYNPFYVNFPELTAMQNVINQWNKATDEVISKEKYTYFVPINDLLYKGMQKTVEADGKADTVGNNLLYTGDRFHPNNTGYQIMANAVFESYVKNHQ